MKRMEDTQETDSLWYCGFCDDETAPGERLCDRCKETARRA